MTTETTPGWEKSLNDPESIVIWLNETVPLIFRQIPAGTFRMGSRGYYDDEEPIHSVEVTQPFLLSAFPVTQHQWRALIERHSPENDSKLELNPSEFSGNFLPVENVDWNQCLAWCELLKNDLSFTKAVESDERLKKLVDEYETVTPTLPFESHWEYACRSGSVGEYFNGDGVGALLDVGWFSENSVDTTHSVGEKLSNGFGLYDMHGNVDEWCLDGWAEHAYKRRWDGITDPFEPGNDSDAGRVIRGGSWYFSAWDCRSAFRGRGGPVYRVRYLGFRVCLFPGPLPSHTRAKRDESVKASRDDVGPPRSPREASENILKNERFPSTAE